MSDRRSAQPVTFVSERRHRGVPRGASLHRVMPPREPREVEAGSATHEFVTSSQRQPERSAGITSPVAKVTGCLK